MGQGLQAWNAAGQLVFDSNYRTTRMAGVVTVTENGTGSIVFSPTPGKNILIYVLQAGYAYYCAAYFQAPNIVGWQIQGIDPGSGFQANIYYGEF